MRIGLDSKICFSTPGSMAPRSEPQISAPRSEPRSVALTSELRSVAPRYQSRQCHLGSLLCMVRHLGAKIYDAEMCYLGAMNYGADPKGPKMSLCHIRSQM